MKLASKIIAAPALAIGFLLLFGVISLIGMVDRGQVLDDVYLARFGGYRSVAEISLRLADSHMQAYRIITWMNGSNDAKVRQMTDGLGRQLKEIDAAVAARLAASGGDENSKADFARLRPDIAKYRKNVLQALDIASADAAMGASALQVADEEYQAINKVLLASVAAEVQAAQLGYEGATVSGRRELALECVVLLVAVMASLGIAITLTRSILRPVHAAAGVSEAISAGDLTVHAEVRGDDEVAQLARSLEAMRGKLSGMVASLRENADRVSAQGAGMTHAADGVAAASATQTHEAHSVAASVEQISTTVATMAREAQQACQVAHASGEAAHEGRLVIGETLREIRNVSSTVAEAAVTIQKLGDDFGEISGIVEIIKEVADQTNLLALNAAIEAARAGDQGRGFAVVADEVRKLAERTSQSTAQIARSIETVRSRSSLAVSEMGRAVEVAAAGVALASRADASNERVTQGTEQLGRAVDAIGAALHEQSAAVIDIAQRVQSIVRMSERNSAAANESAASAKVLNGLAQSVHGEISRFRT